MSIKSFSVGVLIALSRSTPAFRPSASERTRLTSNLRACLARDTPAFTSRLRSGREVSWYEKQALMPIYIFLAVFSAAVVITAVVAFVRSLPPLGCE